MSSNSLVLGGSLHLFLLPGLSCFSLSCFSSRSLLLSTLLFALPCNATLVITACNRNNPKKHLSTAGILNDQLPMLPRHSRSSPLTHLSLQLCQPPLELLNVARLGLKGKLSTPIANLKKYFTWMCETTLTGLDNDSSVSFLAKVISASSLPRRSSLTSRL